MWNIVNNYSIDCFIHKFSYLFPEIPEYLAFLCRSSIEFKAGEDGKVEVDYQKCEKYFLSLLKFYDIEKKRVDINDIMKMSGEINVILPCDSYYFEYSVQNYMSFHLEHNILIKNIQNDDLYVYDDNPFYTGKLSKDVVLASYLYNQHEIYQYWRKNDLKNRDNLSFFYENAKNIRVDLFCFLYGLLYSNCDSQSILRALEELRITFKRYRSFVFVCKSINNVFPGVADKCLTAVLKFLDELTLITNIASIGLRNSERYVKRIKNRLNNLKILEVQLNDQYIELVENLVDYNVEI